MIVFSVIKNIRLNLWLTKNLNINKRIFRIREEGVIEEDAVVVVEEAEEEVEDLVEEEEAEEEEDQNNIKIDKKLCEF